MNEKNMINGKDPLTEEQKDKLKQLGKKKLAKLNYLLLKNYSRLCRKCRQKVTKEAYQNKPMELDGYCVRCQKFQAEAVRKVIE